MVFLCVGFQKILSTEQLREFEEKVSVMCAGRAVLTLIGAKNQKLFQRALAYGQLSNEACNDQDIEKHVQAFQARNEGIENHLKAAEGYV